MKLKLFILLLTTVVPKLLFSQYAKLPTNPNYFWHQWSACNYHYQIQYEKDTLIRGKIYNKYAAINAVVDKDPCSPTFIRQGFLRQDTANRLTFILDDHFNERPLYDFNKLAGDTFQVYQKEIRATITVTVVAVRNSNTNGIQCRTQQVTSSNGDDLFTEGMGAMLGGIFGHHHNLMSDSWEYNVPRS